MPWQLIYTSAPRGLLSGQSGFCTVARSGDLREALVQRLEQLSSYHYLRVAEAATAHRNPTVCSFRILDLRGSKYHVLTRIQPCGLDFTARTNHLAHHLVFQAGELAQLPSPAVILRDWPGWLSAWQGEPRLVDDPALDGFNAAARPCLPAQTWLRVTGDAGRAAGLLESECIRGCYLVCPPGSEAQVLEMFCETLQLLNLNGQYALRPWRHPFTTFLQAEDNPADFQWRACQEGTPACQQAAQRTAGLIPLRAVRVPNNSLVKTAREGLKPPPPPPAAATDTSLTLRRQAPGKRPPGTELMDTAYWQRPVARPEKSAAREFNFSIRSGTIARIGLVVAVLLILWHYRPHPPPVPPENTPLSSTPAPPDRPANPGNSAAVAPPPHESAPVQAPPPDPAQLSGLSGEGPTYVFATNNLITFDLPIDSISRFQNLLQKFDDIKTLPTNILLFLNTNQWGFLDEAPMTVHGMHEHVLSAASPAGLECSFDYSNWKSDPLKPVLVQTTFSPSPAAFSARFGFSNSTYGDPFRLLIVNETNPPRPLRLGASWLKTNCESLAASLQAPLFECLSTNLRLLGGQRLQLQPYIRSKERGQTHCLYRDWPAEDLPPFGDELDFAEVKGRLTARQIPFQKTAAAQIQKLEQQIQQARLDAPLGKRLELTNENLASFSDYTNKPSPGRYIDYLNSLRKNARIKGWPPLSRNDDDADLTAKFPLIYAWWMDQFPGASLMVGETNYFSFVWQKLKEIDNTRQEEQRARIEIDKLQERLDAVPGTLDKVAYVGLFIIDPPKPNLEMIRFQGP